MIRKNMKMLCSEDPSLIENYDKAVADTERLWVCHHRLELDEEGKTVHSKQELIDMGMYWKRPASELIFLTVSDHMALHMNDDARQKLREVHTRLWKNPKRKRIMREKAEEKRRNGLTLQVSNRTRVLRHTVNTRNYSTGTGTDVTRTDGTPTITDVNC